MYKNIKSKNMQSRYKFISNVDCGVVVIVAVEVATEWQQ